MKEPNFFIVGAPKCGTTSLSHWLNQHPSIFLSAVKEPHFFNTDMGNCRRKSFRKYLDLFADATDEHKAIGEASTWYFYSEAAIRNIVAKFPQSRIIVCLRNPIEMAVSLHNQLVTALNEHLNDFEDAWNAQAERRNGCQISKYCIDSAMLQYKDVCSLGAQLDRVARQIPMEQLYWVFLDDMEQNPVEEYSRICCFLGVVPFADFSFNRENASHTYKWEGLQKFHKALRFVKRRLGLPQLNTGLSNFMHQYNTKPYKRPEPDRIFIETNVLPALSADIDKLAEITGRDLSHYKARQNS